MASFCTACGTPLMDETARFCSKCGVAVAAPPPSKPSVAITSPSIAGSGGSIRNDKTLPASGLNTKAAVAVPPKFLSRLSLIVSGRNMKRLILAVLILSSTLLAATPRVRMELGHIFTKPDANGVYPDGSLAAGHCGFYGHATGTDGKPIAGIIVTVAENYDWDRAVKATTDANGYFQIVLTKPGTYNVVFRECSVPQSCSTYALNMPTNESVTMQRWHRVNSTLLTLSENWENGRGSREADMRDMVQKLICPYGYAEGSTDQNVQCKDKPIDVRIVH